MAKPVKMSDLNAKNVNTKVPRAAPELLSKEQNYDGTLFSLSEEPVYYIIYQYATSMSTILKHDKEPFTNDLPQRQKASDLPETHTLSDQ